MTKEEAKRRLLDIERCTPIHTREDVRDFEALEMAIQALSQEPISLNDINNALEASFRNGVRSAKVEQEPCDDAINRILKRMWNCRGKHTTSIDKVAMEQIIRGELSVTQKSGKWIPVSERLPEFDVPVLVYQTYYKGNAITIGRYHSDEERGGYKYWQWIMYDSWFSYGIEHFGIICPNSDFVEAWMPLPKPYEPQESEVRNDT